MSRSRNKITRALLATLLAFWLIAAQTGCDQKPKSGLPLTSMQIGSEHFNLEMALNTHDQEVGLMHRDSLDADHGMVFVFPREEPQTFWNHDVHFGLDLIFLGADAHVVSLKHLNPYDDTAVPSDAPAQYVIELNSGTTARLRVKVGDHLTLPNDVLNSPAARVVQ
jgi:uncharacterized protein